MSQRTEYRRIAEQMTYEDLLDDWVILKEREDELEEKLTNRSLPKINSKLPAEFKYKYSQNQDCGLYFYNHKCHYAITKVKLDDDTVTEGIAIFMPEKMTEDVAFKIQMENQMNNMGDDYENGN